MYRGRVVRVIPGMQAAFVDIGLARAGFLFVNDALPQAPGTDADPENALCESGGTPHGGWRVTPMANIRDLLFA